MAILSDLPKEGYFRAIFFVLCAGALVMALIPQPPRLPIDQYGDKFAHIVAFAVLALFARLGFRAARDCTILERMSFLGALIEVLQAIPELHRDCDWRDWLADTLSVAFVLLVLRLISWRRGWPRPRAADLIGRVFAPVVRRSRSAPPGGDVGPNAPTHTGRNCFAIGQLTEGERRL